MNTDQLVQTLEQAGVLADERVAQAFKAVPRHLFLPGVPLERVYEDRPVYTRTDDAGAFLGGADAPRDVAQMLTLADLRPGQNVLEIGTGTGYNAALIQELIGDEGHVTTIEIDREAHETAQDHLQRLSMGSVNVVHADGSAGYSPRASYDRIISTVALWDIPPAWVRQLRPHGVIVAPLFLDGLQACAALRHQPDGTLYSDDNFSCSFVPIQGQEAPPAQHLYLGGGSALRLYANTAYKMDSAALHMLLSMDAERCHMGVAPSPRDYWDGFIPYMMLNVPQGFQFVVYTVEGGKLVYGLSKSGFGLVQSGSASFACAYDLGDTHCFGGADAFLEVVDGYRAWEDVDRPGMNHMRVQLYPKNADMSPVPRTKGRMFDRRNHILHVWLQPVEIGTTS